MSKVENNEILRLSDKVFQYRNRTLSKQGNIFEGYISSGVYGIRPCVIKFARQSNQNRREADILSKLGHHTNIISLIQSGFYEQSFQSKLYIVLEKCHNLNLGLYIKQQKETLPDYDAEWGSNAISQIIAGMTFIHENLIIHKDLKPSNILLTEDLKTIKIADFGCSQKIESSLSTVYCRCPYGTAGYRPPEGFGGAFTSLKSDIFSLAVVFIFILSNGESPFGKDVHNRDHHIKTGFINIPKLLVSNPRVTEHLLKAMLRMDRCRRPTIEQVANHPCWTGKETDCTFDYEYIEETACKETDDSTLSDEQSTTSSDSDGVIEAISKVASDCVREMRASVEKNDSSDSKYYDEKAKLHLSKTVYLYKNRPLSTKKNVFEGFIIDRGRYHQPCAIKIETKSAKTIREARILAKLSNHLHVISLKQHGVYQSFVEDKFYIALEKCHKINLRQYLLQRKGNKLAFNDSWGQKITNQIISGVQYIHKNLIIHKDLEPSNFLFSGNLTTIKITDFSSSQIVKSSQSMVYSSYGYGTAGFRPPEAFGGEYTSLKSDIFSLGAVFIFILSNGESPFNGINYVWDANVKNAESALPEIFVPNPKTTMHLLLMMLQRERRRRPTIDQVSEHPCWQGKEVDYEFDYGFIDEIEDSGFIRSSAQERGDDVNTEMKLLQRQERENNQDEPFVESKKRRLQ